MVKLTFLGEEPLRACDKNGLGGRWGLCAELMSSIAYELAHKPSVLERQ